MKPVVIVVVALALCVASPAAAQSDVTRIYTELANNAARAARERDETRSRMIADLTALAVEIANARRVVPAPVVVSPVLEAPPAAVVSPSVFTAQRQYLEEALAYAKEEDNERRAAMVVAYEGFFAAPVAECMGTKPIKPVTPIGCRDLVAFCVVNRDGTAAWQWVCVK